MKPRPAEFLQLLAHELIPPGYVATWRTSTARGAMRDDPGPLLYPRRAELPRGYALVDDGDAWSGALHNLVTIRRTQFALLWCAYYWTARTLRTGIANAMFAVVRFLAWCLIREIPWGHTWRGAIKELAKLAKGTAS